MAGGNDIHADGMNHDKSRCLRGAKVTPCMNMILLDCIVIIFGSRLKWMLVMILCRDLIASMCPCNCTSEHLNHPCISLIEASDLPVSDLSMSVGVEWVVLPSSNGCDMTAPYCSLLFNPASKEGSSSSSPAALSNRSNLHALLRLVLK